MLCALSKIADIYLPLSVYARAFPLEFLGCLSWPPLTSNRSISDCFDLKRSKVGEVPIRPRVGQAASIGDCMDKQLVFSLSGATKSC